jgi:PAS domain S-box-containing protein
MSLPTSFSNSTPPDNAAGLDPRLLLAAIVESSDDAIISKDLEGTITSWNAAAQRLFGYAPEEIVGKSVLTLIPAHLQHEEPEILARLKANLKIDHYETQRVTKTGEVLEVSLTISPIRNEAGVVVGASKIARDISERKKAQRALIDSEKLAATARMAATIAHEINNPLESVTNLAYLLATDNTLNDSAHKYAEMLLAEVSRASDIARQTLSFYRDNSTPSSVDVGELVRSMAEVHAPRLEKRNVKLLISLEEGARVWGLNAEIRQVLMNLLLNATDAVSEKGEVRIRVRTVREKVHIVVCDNGHGIPKQYRRRVFDPFFTTKNSKGNGLGLWVSKGIVEKHHGQIRLRSRMEGDRHGTVFQVILPDHHEERSKSNVA